MHVTATCPSSEQRHAGGQRHVTSLRLSTRARRDTCHTCGLMAPHHGPASQNTSDLTCQSLVTRLQLVPGHFYQLSSVDLISVCPCPCVIMTCFPGRDVVGEGTQAALATGPGAGLWSSHQPPPPPTSQTHNSQF